MTKKNHGYAVIFFVIAVDGEKHTKNIFAYPKKDILLHHLFIKCHFSSAGRATHS